MIPQRLPRWTTLLVLPLLAGGLLLMHGVDAGVSTGGFHEASVTAPTHSHHGETPTEHHAADCDGCTVGHIMAACMAIVATVVGLRLARRATGTSVSTLVDSATNRIGAARQRLRPLDPAWVRLAVMRC
jgi:hypothetical protein